MPRPFRADGAVVSPGFSNPSRLLRLPAELRQKIYLEALVQRAPVVVEVFKDVRNSARAPKQPALLHTCRQIRAEALRDYYRRNIFRVSTDSIGLARRTLTPVQRSALDRYINWMTTIEVDLGCTYGCHFCIKNPTATLDQVTVEFIVPHPEGPEEHWTCGPEKTKLADATQEYLRSRRRMGETRLKLKHLQNALRMLFLPEGVQRQSQSYLLQCLRALHL